MPLGQVNTALYFQSMERESKDGHDQTGSMDDLERAITHAQEAVQATPLDHPDRAIYLFNLGNRFRERYSRIGDKKAEEESVRLFEKGAKCSTSLPLHRVRSGRNAIRVLHRSSRWKEAAAIVETLFGLLPQICGRYLSRDDQQHVLKQVSGFAADACFLSVKMNNPRQALQRIESGRVLILGYLMDGRSDLSELTLAHPDLAREYDELRVRAFRIDTVGDRTARDNWPSEQHNIPRLIEECENRIRDKPGFSCFLRPFCP